VSPICVNNVNDTPSYGYSIINDSSKRRGDIKACNYSPNSRSTFRGSTFSNCSLLATYSADIFFRRWFLDHSLIRFRPSKRLPSLSGSSGSVATFGTKWRRPPPSTTCASRVRFLCLKTLISDQAIGFTSARVSADQNATHGKLSRIVKLPRVRHGIPPPPASVFLFVGHGVSR